MTIDIKKTKRTPAVSFDKESSTLIIKGPSIPEASEAERFYNLLIVWATRAVTMGELSIIEVTLEYFNQATIRQLVGLFKTLEKAKDPLVIWHYEKGDDTTLEAGRDLASVIDVRLGYIEDR